MSHWKPTATQHALKARAEMNRSIREFFSERSVMETETPLLNSAPVADPNIDPVEVYGTAGIDRLWLHTSPEYSMKRLLCAGSGDIYSLGKVFRAGEAGGRHNPEFTMLEWYRIGFDHNQLMAEVGELLDTLLGKHTQSHLTYRQAMKQYADIDPFTATDDEISETGKQLAGADLGLDRDGWLDIIMSHQVEKQLPSDHFTFISDYPASQAALSKVKENGNGHQVAERFEVYFRGIELANGYHELTNAEEQQRRFEKELSGSNRPVDQRLLNAMKENTLPDCAGVALGADRLLMLKLEAASIEDVLAFSFTRC